MSTLPLGARRVRAVRDALQAIHDRHRNVATALSVAFDRRTVTEERLGYADLDELVIVGLTNSWGVGATCGEFLIEFPARIAEIVVG